MYKAPTLPRQQFHGSKVSVGAVINTVGMVASIAMADKLKTREERLLFLAGVGVIATVANTMWREHVKKQRHDMVR